MILNRHKLKKRLIWLLPLIVLGLVLSSKAFWRFIYPFPYEEIVAAEAARNNVDPHLVAAIIKTESNFTSGAESKVGARGIMQIMPETGLWAANKMNLKGFAPDDLYKTETNIKIGCWYLNNLNREFKGNKILVVAAYNGGRGNVRAWLEKEQWTGEHATVDQIPFSETRTYVKKVLKNYSWYRYLYGDGKRPTE
ncbi:MAG: lytic transglycosylase domain-containing protein [Eubacteriales bacterium]